MGELKWNFELFGIRVAWQKHFSTICLDRRNRLVQIGKLEFWKYQ